ncbi:MAG: phosphotriesterase-related protein [Acidobacteria bacterium]|nr:MAG: phosphotriesterase-related protein [Acidobacteriota bacterium]
MKHTQSTRLSRREALGMLGAGAGLGLFSISRGPRLAAWGIQAPNAARRAMRIPKGAIIRTILKDLPPDGLGNGAILFHEHMSFDSSFFEKMRPAGAPRPATPPPRSYLENVDAVTEEVRATGKEGVSCIVDGGHADMGTSYANLRTIAERSGVHIVASGGYYLQTTYPADVAAKSENELVEGLVRDAATGRWGAFGEIGSSPEMTADERKVFRGIGQTQRRTALPIFTHTSHAGCRKCGLEQLDILESAGADPQHVCIGHLSDITDDTHAETHKDIAKRGAFLGFDTVGHRLAQGDAKKVSLIKEVLDAGYEDHVLLSSDFASEPETKFNGGAGYSSVTAVFVPKLRYAGVSEATLHKILVDNPKRFLAFVPPKTS